MFKKRHGIILSCDVTSLIEVEKLALLSTEFSEVVGFKVGFDLGLRYGLKKVTNFLKQINPLPVIYDHQKAGTDIPQMGGPFALCCKDSEVDGVIILAQSGPNTLEAFVTSIIAHGMVPIVGGIMSHPGYLASDGGYISDEAPTAIYKKAVELGVANFIMPGNKPEITKHFVTSVLQQNSNQKNIIMPGIGQQGGDIKSSFEAASFYPAYAIIGSAIYNAPDSKQALSSFAEQVRACSQVSMYGSGIGP